MNLTLIKKKFPPVNCVVRRTLTFNEMLARDNSRLRVVTKVRGVLEGRLLEGFRVPPTASLKGLGVNDLTGRPTSFGILVENSTEKVDPSRGKVFVVGERNGHFGSGARKGFEAIKVDVGFDRVKDIQRGFAKQNGEETHSEGPDVVLAARFKVIPTGQRLVVARKVRRAGGRRGPLETGGVSVSTGVPDVLVKQKSFRVTGFEGRQLARSFEGILDPMLEVR